MRIGTVKDFKIQGITLGLLAGLFMVGAAWASEAGGHGQGGIDPAKLPDLLWRTVNFVIFAGILYKLAAKPIKTFLPAGKPEINTELPGSGIREDQNSEGFEKLGAISSGCRRT
jgi:hypothetical protein